jgi:hypothetical protein
VPTAGNFFFLSAAQSVGFLGIEEMRRFMTCFVSEMELETGVKSGVLLSGNLAHIMQSIIDEVHSGRSPHLSQEMGSFDHLALASIFHAKDKQWKVALGFPESRQWVTQAGERDPQFQYAFDGKVLWLTKNREGLLIPFASAFGLNASNVRKLRQAAHSAAASALCSTKLELLLH